MPRLSSVRVSVYSLVVGAMLVIGQFGEAPAGELLAGKVSGAGGEGLAGIPVKAKKADSPLTVAVYTDSQGDYSFPEWSDLAPGQWSVTVDLPDFETGPVGPVDLVTSKVTNVNLRLKPKALAYEDATVSEIIAALPGTDHEKTLFSQCGNCHTLQWALQAGRSKSEWIATIRKMSGRAADMHQPGTYAFSQKQFIEPLAEYLEKIRGPESSDVIPFKQRPRPTGSESSNLVVTEYDLPRGGERELYMLRGDKRFVWPHDVIVNGKYAYYTDHFSYVLGRLDLQSGKAIEMPFELPAGAGRGARGDTDGRPGDPGGGAHELQFDHEGNVVIGMDNGTVKYDPKTGKFLKWAVGSPMFGLDPKGNVWAMRRNGELNKIDTSDENLKPVTYLVPKNGGIYDMDTDSKGRTYFYIWREGKVGIFDPEKVAYEDFKTPTAMSGPRRGWIDEKDRLWAAEFYAGQILMLDPDKRELREYPLLPGTRPYTPPFAAPYSVSPDVKNGFVWTNDFNSNRLYRINMETGQSQEYMTPSNYELRNLFVDRTAARPTVWLPSYRPPSKLVKVQMR